MFAHVRTDQNLLFGILALQMDFVSRDALIAAMHAWVLQKATPLGQILLDQGTLRADTHSLLEALVQKHLQLHDGDAQKSLAAVSSLGSARQHLEQIADDELHHSLAHVAAARADLGAVLRQVERGEFRPSRQVKDTVPTALEAVCLKAMALRPKDRYASPRALAEDVEHWLADEPVDAWREPWGVRTRRWVSRHRTLVTASAATLLVATVSLIVATVLLQASNNRERQANSDKLLALGEKEVALSEAETNAADARRHEEVARERKRQAEANAADAKRQTGIAEKRSMDLKAERGRTRAVLANSSVRLADYEWAAGHVVRARELLAGVPADLRYWEWNYLHRKFQGGYCTLYGHTGEVTSVAFSPAGKQLASGSKDKTVKIWDAVTGQEIRTLKGHIGEVTSIAFSSDGKQLASGRRLRW